MRFSTIFVALALCASTVLAGPGWESADGVTERDLGASYEGQLVARQSGKRPRGGRGTRTNPAPPPGPTIGPQPNPPSPPPLDIGPPALNSKKRRVRRALEVLQEELLMRDLYDLDGYY